MRFQTAVPLVLLLLPAPLPAQRFGFTHQMLPADADDSRAVALGDVDGDGDLDAFVGVTGQDRLVLNDGAGVFSDVTSTNLPPLSGATKAVSLGDLDGDGDLDAFVGNSGQDRLEFNDGTGVFTDATGTNLPALFDDTSAVALGDVDGDGDVDAYVGNGSSNPLQNRLYLNVGNGVYADVTATNLPALLDNSWAVALGDVDGDGDLDVFVGNFGQDRLHLNGGTGAFADVTTTNLPVVLDATFAVALGDVDGDGDLDALVGNYGQQQRLHLNGGTGTFTDVTATNLPVLVDWTNAVALGDVDGDGDLDALVGNNGQQNRLQLNAGGGTFADATGGDLPPLVSETTTAVVLGDVDGDGDLDAFLGSGSSGLYLDRLYLNQGTGAYTDVTATNLPALVDNTWDLALGDVDADGDLDVFVGNFGQDRLYLNGGTAMFADATATNLPALIGATTSVALGDVDGDGDLDTFLGGAQERLYLNGGTGLFADATGTNLPGSADPTQAIALGDVDGDGDLDAFVGNGGFQGRQNRLHVNSGTGVFADVTATNLPAVLDGTFDVALGDVDGDGDPDALIGNWSEPDRLHENDGTGAFADVTPTNLPILSDATRAVALGDVDGDGDLDGFVGAGSGFVERIYTNLSRQLAWRGIPRAGKLQVLDLWGPGNGTWLLAASAGSASVPVPSVGTLRLLPSTLFIVAGGTLDPQGRADVSFPVPANPALVGLSLYWQALVGPPLRFTNLEIATVTNL
ncbi:MAG: VCBS repeat-containing protein [Planctomycetes bacterium]|nr:VCBS repeat-containing protein [Planctomycetota bacterium]